MARGKKGNKERKLQVQMENEEENWREKRKEEGARELKNDNVLSH